jgi:hypothetical protein
MFNMFHTALNNLIFSEFSMEDEFQSKLLNLRLIMNHKL